jgi:hypothetical protein
MGDNNSLNKILLINLASHDSGFGYLEHPIEHTLIFYLIIKNFLQIANFNFGVDYYPSFSDFAETTYLRSLELDNDLRSLVASNFLKLERASIPKYKITKNTLSLKSVLIDFCNTNLNITYEDLGDTIKDILKNKHAFLEECYRLYLLSL